MNGVIIPGSVVAELLHDRDSLCLYVAALSAAQHHISRRIVSYDPVYATDGFLAKRVGKSEDTVARWRKRLASSGLCDITLTSRGYEYRFRPVSLDTYDFSTAEISTTLAPPQLCAPKNVSRSLRTLNANQTLSPSSSPRGGGDTSFSVISERREFLLQIAERHFGMYFHPHKPGSQVQRLILEVGAPDLIRKAAQYVLEVDEQTSVRSPWGFFDFTLRRLAKEEKETSAMRLSEARDFLLRERAQYFGAGLSYSGGRSTRDILNGIYRRMSDAFRAKVRLEALDGLFYEVFPEESRPRAAGKRHAG